MQTATRETSRLGSLTVNDSIHGGVIEGFDVYRISSYGGDNWIVRDCLFKDFYGLYFSGLSTGWTIENCIKTNQGTFISTWGGQAFTGLTVRNCITEGLIGNMIGDGNLIVNTLFISNTARVGNSSNATIRNCIFIDSPNQSFQSLSSYGCYECQWWNNISAGNGFAFLSNFPGFQDNIDGVSTQDLFVSWSGPLLNYLEDDFNLLPGSVAEGGGLLGVDIGVYGGSSAFKQNTFYHAWPDTPQILQFGTTNPTLVQGDSLQVGGIVVPGHLN